MKTCSKCRIEKPLTAFSRDKRSRDGLNCQCKDCVAQTGREWYQKNKERHQARGKTWVENNRERIRTRDRERDKAYREAHKEEYKAANKAYYTANKERLQKKSREWYAKNLERSRDVQRRYHERNPKIMYGLSLEAYQAMLETQGGVCAICQQPQKWHEPSKKPRSLCVDHDHFTGQIRGLLCNACNVAIGAFKDDPERMTRAMDYLARAVKQRKIKQLGLFD